MEMSEEDKLILRQEIKAEMEAEAAERKGEEPVVATEEELRKAYTPTKTAGSSLTSNAIKQMVLVAVVVTSLILIALSSFGGGGFVVKKDFETNMVNMAVAIENAMADINNSQGQVQEIIATMPDTIGDTIAEATKDFTDWRVRLDAAVAANKQQLDTNTNSIGNVLTNVEARLATSIAESDAIVSARLAEGNEVLDGTVIAVAELNAWRGRVDSSLVTTNERIDALEARLDELYNGYEDDNGGSDGSPINVKISNSGGMLVGSDNNTLSAPIKITITKPSGLAVEDIVMFLELQTEGIPNFATVKLSGGGVSWRSSGWQSSGGYFYSVEFMNTGWGLDMSKSDTKKNIYATLEIKGTGYLEKEYAFDIDVTIDDWE